MDVFNLNRFIEAQRESYGRVVAELRRGEKRTHWMWYIFPQILGLGRSPTSEHFAIRSREEAQAYLDQPVLGARLIECAAIVLGLEGRTVNDIFGSPDDLKFHSSMTLFARATAGEPVFMRALEKYFGSRLDVGTLDLLEGGPPP